MPASRERCSHFATGCRIIAGMARSCEIILLINLSGGYYLLVTLPPS